jgi:hypothetical protein
MQPCGHAPEPSVGLCRRPCRRQSRDRLPVPGVALIALAASLGQFRPQIDQLLVEKSFSLREILLPLAILLLRQGLLESRAPWASEDVVSAAAGAPTSDAQRLERGPVQLDAVAGALGRERAAVLDPQRLGHEALQPEAVDLEV